MTAKDWISEQAEAYWDSEGSCASCGWHAALYEYDLPDDAEWNPEYRRIEMSCLNPESAGCRGVRIYPLTEPPKP